LRMVLSGVVPTRGVRGGDVRTLAEAP